MNIMSNIDRHVHRLDARVDKLNWTCRIWGEILTILHYSVDFIRLTSFICQLMLSFECALRMFDWSLVLVCSTLKALSIHWSIQITVEQRPLMLRNMWALYLFSDTVFWVKYWFLADPALKNLGTCVVFVHIQFSIPSLVVSSRLEQVSN